MDRHLLVAVSEQKSALHGVRFVSQFFNDKTHIKSTFFYSSPKPLEPWGDKKQLGALQTQNTPDSGKFVIESAVKEATQLGFPKNNLFPKLQQRMFTKVSDIIHEGEKGGYDAVVLGRRCISMLEAAFDESVSQSLFKEHLPFPLWLCRSSDPNRKHVLFHADGSQTSFTMADHVGFMLCMENRHNIDILPTESVEKDSRVKERYAEIFKDHGLAPERVTWVKTPKGDLASNILESADRNAYAAVALGRSNSKESMFSRLFKGPVCSRLFKDLNNSALWVCQ